MTSKSIQHVTTSSNQVIVTCEDGSILFLTIGNLGATVSYAPDSDHYPEMMQIDDKGRERYPTVFTSF